MDFSKEFTRYQVVYGSVQSETPTVINCFDSSNVLASILTFYPDSDVLPHDSILVSSTPFQNFLTINFHRKEFPAIHQVLLNERPLFVSCTFENFGAIGFFQASKSCLLSSKSEPIGEQEP